MNKIEITPELLADLKTKAEKATPGPWEWYPDAEASGEIYSLGGNPACGYTDEDTDFIVAANPQTVLALLEYIERLKIELHDLDSSSGEMAKDLRQLEKEADWLAERLQTICRHEVPDVCTMLNIEKCPFFPGGEIFNGSCKLKCKSEPVNWREAARKAMEERCKNN